MASTIGIKLANGEFYSIVEENSNIKKRMILTTVHDTQRSMQIDLYKSFTRSMADALYIGSIVVENIKEKPKGGPSIELIITSNANGEIIADAIDLDSSSSNTGEYLHLIVSLKSLEENIGEPEDFNYDFQDFDFHEPPPAGLYEKAAPIQEKKGHKSLWLILIVIGALLIILGFCLWFFVLPDQDGQTALTQAQTQPVSEPEAAVAPEPPAPEPEPEAAVAPEPQAPEPEPASVTESRRTEAPVIEAPSAPPSVSKNQEAAPRRSRRNPPVASYNVPKTIPREGHPYQIRWGDTLWDISEAFYRNPWLYPRIARFNAIRNPDRIVAGRTIRIPSKN
ncbi:MAG: LysM peptidoglycan-binding domain-containing protein [Treponema sp.]|jgi:hypothetical protein|nr:LysM peptidoglycan-binding domain-containing protein [Treponema sp.]